MLSRLVAALIAVFFASSSFAQVCTVGCPCGNTCISCADTCRVGGGTASNAGGGGSDSGLLIAGAVVGASCLVAVPLLLFAYSMTASGQTAAPSMGAVANDMLAPKPSHPVGFLLRSKCAWTTVVGSGPGEVTATGCDKVWTCLELSGSWTCSEPEAAPSKPAKRPTNDDFN